MNMRLARPSHLDINGVAELGYINVVGSELHIGALTRQREIELSPEVGRSWPLLTTATKHIGHIPIRVRGTIGGSLAHFDPTAELPLALVALDGRMESRASRVDGPFRHGSSSSTS